MDEFATHISDVFRLFGPVALRPMFSGYGVFRDGLMFGFVADDILYLKADSQTIDDFTRLGLSRFEYARQGKTVGLSFYQAPETMMEDPEEAALWAGKAFDAALRGHAAKGTRAKTRR